MAAGKKLFAVRISSKVQELIRKDASENVKSIDGVVERLLLYGLTTMDKNDRRRLYSVLPSRWAKSQRRPN
jgi:hypothetical protein